MFKRFATQMSNLIAGLIVCCSACLIGTRHTQLTQPVVFGRVAAKPLTCQNLCWFALAPFQPEARPQSQSIVLERTAAKPFKHESVRRCRWFDVCILKTHVSCVARSWPSRSSNFSVLLYSWAPFSTGARPSATIGFF